MKGAIYGRDGRFTGDILSASSEALLWRMVPAGMGLYLFDGDSPNLESQCVTPDGALIACRPINPPWELRRFAAERAAMDEILAAESTQARPLRELVEAMLGNEPTPAEPLARLSDIKSRIESARARLVSIRATRNDSEFDALMNQQA